MLFTTCRISIPQHGWPCVFDAADFQFDTQYWSQHAKRTSCCFGAAREDVGSASAASTSIPSAMSVAHGLPLIFDVADPVTKTAILTAAEGIGSDDAKAGALGSLAERLPEPRRTEILERALTAAEGIGNEGRQGRRARLTGGAPAGAPSGAAADGGRGDRRDEAEAGALGSLAERLPERLLERALTAAEGIGNDGAKAGALGSLAERLPERAFWSGR